MKRLFSIIIPLSMLAFTACESPENKGPDDPKIDNTNIAVESVSLNKTEHTMEIDDEFTLTATVLPANATDKNIEWESSNKAIVTVENGVVKAIAEGNATVTVTAADNKTESCDFTITAPDLPPPPPPEVKEEKLARSNIVWMADSSKPEGGFLTFAVTRDDNDRIPANVQGVYFRWGSLVAVSPVSGSYSPASILFAPSGDKTYEWWTSGGVGWGELPYINNWFIRFNYEYGEPHPFGNYVITEDDFATYNDGTGFDAATDTGDICRYITSRGWVEGKWRMPTNKELDLSAEGKLAVVANTAAWQNVNVPDNAENAAGLYRLDTGYFFGAAADADDDQQKPLQGAIFLPASGCRSNTNGNTMQTGTYGYLWSGSSAMDDKSSQLVYYEEKYGYPEQARGYAGSVRCIRIDEE